MTLLDWFSILAIILCLIFSFVFAGSETALMAFSRARMLRLEKKGNRSAGIVNRLLESRERLIGALLLGNNAVNIAASSLATSVFLVWFGDVVVLAEVLPKTVAINDSDRIALLVAKPIELVVRLLGPVLAAIEALVRSILRVTGWNVDADKPVLSAHE